MSRKLPILQRPLIYLITAGATTSQTNSNSANFSAVLNTIEKAVAAKIPLIQIREKSLNARTLYELTVRASSICQGTESSLLVNDRSDIAYAAGADGVHLTTQSLPVGVIRATYPSDFLIGVSTHSLAEAEAAKSQIADFIVFGPVFETASKRIFGDPQGSSKLSEVTTAVAELPVIAIGGIDLDNSAECFRSGAVGVAAITLFNDPERLESIVEEITRLYEQARPK